MMSLLCGPVLLGVALIVSSPRIEAAGLALVPDFFGGIGRLDPAVAGGRRDRGRRDDFASAS